MKVAAYQAPLLPAGSFEAIDLIRAEIAICERERVDVLCCPEGIVGGLADYAPDPWNGLPRDRDRAGMADQARALDVAHATRSHLWVVRADVVGDNGTLASDGASGIVDPGGRLVARPCSAAPELLVCTCQDLGLYCPADDSALTH